MKKLSIIKLTAFFTLLYITISISFIKVCAAEYSCKIFPGEKINVQQIIKTDSSVEETHKATCHSFRQGKIASYKNGVIKGKNTGKTILTITYDDGSFDTIRIKVKKEIRKIDIPQKKMSLNKNDTRSVYVNITRNDSSEPVIWKSSNKKILTVNDKGEVTGKKNGTAYIICKSKYSGKKDKIKITVKKTKYIAFTFDDGPSIYTDKLLDALEKHNSKATFFVLGSRVKKYPDLIDAQSEYGHQIGNHTYNHPILTKLKKSEIKKQIKETNKLIKKQTGSQPETFRPPYGAYDKTVKKHSNAPLILWSVDTLDWKYRNSDYVKKTILSNADDGEIVLLHDIHKTSVDGFIRSLDTLKKRGYELVTVDELFKINGKKLKNGSVYYYCK